MLAACLCGALFCTQVNAKVCFVGDPDCTQGAEFEEYTPPATDNLCTQEGYTSKATECNNIGAVCPYDASYVRCCEARFAYQACIYPLEYIENGDTVEKCGKLYACKCPEEYNITAEEAKNNNCDPLGVCMVNEDGTGDKIYYKTCDCNRTIYTDVSSCKNNQDESASCTDDTGATYKKCYCDRSTAKYPHAACEYGSKGAVCVDSNSNREYYHQCKSARERCLEENYVAENLSQCPPGETACTSPISGKKYYCALGDGCPYPTVPQLYKCQFDKGRWCKAQGYNQESSTPITLNAKCIDQATGLEGKANPCTENTDTPTYYYQCKLTCEQQVRSAVSQGYLTTTSNVLDSKNNFGFIRSAGGKKHLYIIGDLGLPKGEMHGGGWSSDKMAKEDFASVNGINALYDIDPVRYSSCAEKRSYSDRPTIYLSNKRITSANSILDVDLSDINIVFVMNDGDGDGKEDYQLKSNHIWKNVGFSHSANKDYVKSLGLTDSCKMRGSSERNSWKDIVYDNNRNKINVLKKSTLTLTGDIHLYMGGGCFSKDKNNLKNNEGCGAYTNFYIGDKWGKIIFDNADISGSSSNDFDCAQPSTVLFKNSTGYVGKLWSQCNVGLMDSNIQLSLLHIQPHNNSEANTSFGGGVELNADCYKKTPGVYLKNSTLTLGSKYDRWPSNIRNDSDYGKMYISKDSKVIVYGSLFLGPGSSVCFPDAGGTKYVTSTKGGYRLQNGDNGNAVVAFSGSYNSYQRLYFYDKNDNWTCMPYNQGVCTNYDQYKRSYVLGHTSATGHYGNWSGTEPDKWKPGWENSFLFPACYNMQACGLGYNN